MAVLGMDYDDPPRPTRYLAHDDLLEIGKLRFTIRHCPGHTRGHIVLVEASERAVFTGDCVISGSIVRTDLPGCDYKTLLD
jgi:hydroxyacylglutathione hydrolase